jgi:hypothetical protein
MVDDDPIADLSHVAAFEPEAEAAVGRAARAALAAASRAVLRDLPPPPHLAGGASHTAGSCRTNAAGREAGGCSILDTRPLQRVAKRLLSPPLPGRRAKENKGQVKAVGSKRAMGDGLADNVFASFACPDQG